MSAKQIIREVARKHNLQTIDILGTARFSHFCAARREAARTLRGLGYTNGQIGMAMRRDSSTVQHYCSPKSQTLKRERMRRLREQGGAA
jgi:chromosomal replication initiation ATPase DnaA